LDFNVKNENGNNPLSLATIDNNVEIVKLLIEYANQHQIILNVNEKNKYGWFPIMNAVSYNNIEIIKLLIDYANQYQIVLI